MSKENPKILVIEDEAMLLQAIYKKMSLMNMEPMIFTRGEDALKALESMPELPDAIWLDYYLGGIDGLMVMKRIKDNERWSRIPVIVVSNSANDEKVHNFMVLGIKKYFVKADSRLEDIINEIKNIVQSEDSNQ